MTATEINAPSFAAVLGCKEKFVQTRLVALGHGSTCGRCGGSGHYSFCPMYGTTCFGCGGSGKAATALTAKLIRTVKVQVEAGELLPYLANLAHKREMAAKVKGMSDKIFAAWGNQPTLVKDKAEGRNHHTTQSDRQTDINEFCAKLTDEAGKLIGEIKDGTWSKEYKGYIKLADETVESHTARLLEILALVGQSETLAPKTAWDEKTNRTVNV